MFISPCSLRSTQCAALIALAAVAGIARVETTRQAPAASPAPAPVRQIHPSLTSLNQGASYAVPTSTAPWLQPAATLALWFLSGSDLHAGTDDRVSVPAFRTALHVALPSTGADCLPDPASCAPSLGRRTTPRPAFCTRTHLIPFAVGPPACGLSLPPRPVGIAVLADHTVRDLSVAPSAFSFFRFDARLACPEFSGLIRVGPSFSPCFALRGKPARLPATLSCHPSLGASARPISGLSPV